MQHRNERKSGSGNATSFITTSQAPNACFLSFFKAFNETEKKLAHAK